MNLKSYFAVATPFPPVIKYRKATKEKDLKWLSYIKLVEKEPAKNIEVAAVSTKR